MLSRNLQNLQFKTAWVLLLFIAANMENYKKLLLGLCKYHSNLEDKIEDLELAAKDETLKLSKRNGKASIAGQLKKQASAISFFVYSFQDDMEKFFGTNDIKVVARHQFYEEDYKLSWIDKIPVEKLGVRKDKGNWRLNQLKHITKQ